MILLSLFACTSPPSDENDTFTKGDSDTASTDTAPDDSATDAPDVTAENISAELTAVQTVIRV